MDPKEMAELLNGREYLREMTYMEKQLAKDFNLVVVYGYSDDNMEFEGSMSEEIPCFDGGFACFDKEGNIKFNEATGYYDIGSNRIEAIWCGGKDEDGNTIPWTYKTNIPHETFMIMEDEEPYCRGIVFRMEDLIA